MFSFSRVLPEVGSAFTCVGFNLEASILPSLLEFVIFFLAGRTFYHEFTWIAFGFDV